MNKWPEDAPYVLCLTHDVDRVEKQIYHYVYHCISHGVEGLSRQLGSIGERLRGHEPYWNFERLMNLEEEMGVRSTFLFLNESAHEFSPKFWGRYNIQDDGIKRVIRELHSGGWEIGLHGSYYSYNNYELINSEKNTLEDILGASVVSTRQHFLNFDSKLTWLIQKRAGLEVDSTIGRVKTMADRASTPYIDKESGLLELPITIMDTSLAKSAPVEAAINRLFVDARDNSGLVVLDWHQCAFNPTEHETRVVLYRQLIERALSDRAWIATMAQINEYIRALPAVEPNQTHEA